MFVYSLWDTIFVAFPNFTTAFLSRRKLPDPQEFLDETKWIYEKLRLRDKKYNDVAYQKKIF
jgi:hypothetical protein